MPDPELTLEKSTQLLAAHRLYREEEFISR